MNQNYLRQNLLALLEAHSDLSESELSRKTGVPQPTINRLLSGVTPDPRVSTVRDLARFFGVRIEQLLGDEPLPDFAQTKKTTAYEKPNSLPLIAWEHVPVWRSFTDKKRLLLEEEKIVYVYTKTKVSTDAYAILIKDRLLYKYFPHNSILIIDPQLAPQNGEYIIVYLPDEEITVIETVINFDGNNHLAIQHNRKKIALIDENITLCGTVVEAIIPMTDR